MRALVIDGNGPRLEADRADPRAQAGSVLVRVLWAGLGGLDLAAVAGRIDHRGVLGHEAVGEVLAPAAGMPAGALVAVAPDLACGGCDLCRSGLSAHCRGRRLLGFFGTDGGLAELLSVPRQNVSVLPARVPTELAVLAQPVADAVHIARMVPIERQTYVTVLGDGLSALLVAQVLARRNASVRLLGSLPDRMELCERWGVRHRLSKEAGLRADQDVVVACPEPDAQGRGDPEALIRTGVGMLRPRGTLVLHGPPVRFRGPTPEHAGLAEAVADSELRVLGARRGSIAEGLAAIAAGQVDLPPLISRRARLGEGVALLRAADKPGHLRTLVEIAA